MLPNRFLHLVPYTFGSICSAFPAVHDVIQSPILPTSSYQDAADFESSETVYGIAEGLGRLQSKNLGIKQLSENTHTQIIKQDIVSTKFYSYSIPFNLSVSGGIWGYTQKPGYYRFADDYTSMDASANDIGNDLALLAPEDLTAHVREAIEELNNITYPYLDETICGGPRSLREALNTLGSREAMTASIVKGSSGVSISLTTGVQSTSLVNDEFTAASAVSFVTIINNGILQRVFEQGWIDYVDAFIVEIYLALGHRIADQAAILADGKCVEPEDAVAGMNTLNDTLDEFLNTEIYEEEPPEL